MDIARLIREHAACDIVLLGELDGVLQYEGSLTGAEQTLSDALISEHIEDTDIYVKAKLDTACPTVYSLATGQQWDDLIQLQKDVKKNRINTVSAAIDLTAALHVHLAAEDTNHSDKLVLRTEYYDAADAFLAEYYPDE